MSLIDEKQIFEAFRKNRPYLLNIEEMVKELKFGQLNISIRVHDSRVTDLTVQSFQKIRYDLGPGGVATASTDKNPDPNLFKDFVETK